VGAVTVDLGRVHLRLGDIHPANRDLDHDLDLHPPRVLDRGRTVPSRAVALVRERVPDLAVAVLEVLLAEEIEITEIEIEIWIEGIITNAATIMSTETATIVAVDTVPTTATTAVEDIITTIHTTTEARRKITTTITDLLLPEEEEADLHHHEEEIVRITMNQLHKICALDHEEVVRHHHP